MYSTLISVSQFISKTSTVPVMESRSPHSNVKVI